MLNHTIFRFLLKIFSNLSVKNKPLYCFNIFIPKFISNIKNNTVLKFFKINCFNPFNLRNKLNSNKSSRSLLNNKKKIGKARLGSSASHVLRKGIVWYGLRKLSLHKNKITKNLLNFLIIFNKYNTSFTALESLKFIHTLNTSPTTITNNITNLLNLSKKNNIFVNFVNKYSNVVNEQAPLNFIY